MGALEAWQCIISQDSSICWGLKVIAFRQSLIANVFKPPWCFSYVVVWLRPQKYPFSQVSEHTPFEQPNEWSLNKSDQFYKECQLKPKLALLITFTTVSYSKQTPTQRRPPIFNYYRFHWYSTDTFLRLS